MNAIASPLSDFNDDPPIAGVESSTVISPIIVTANRPSDNGASETGSSDSADESGAVAAGGAPEPDDKNKPKETKPGKSGKAAKDAPSWAKGKRPTKSENSEKFAKRLMNDKYGQGNWKKGPGSEFNNIKKWVVVFAKLFIVGCVKKNGFTELSSYVKIT